MTWYARLPDLTKNENFSSATTKAAFTSQLDCAANAGWTEQVPGGNAAPEGWIGLKADESKLVLELPGGKIGPMAKKWRWFRVEDMDPKPNKYGEGVGFVRLATDKKHLEMFSLLSYFLLLRMAGAYIGGASPAVLVQKALDEWEQYLGARAEDPSSRHTGAFGEIYILLRLINETAPQAVLGWAGPLGKSQDISVTKDNVFVAGVEVKTIGADADSLSINGVDQLASPGLLLAVRLGSSTTPIYSGSLKDLVCAVKGALKDHPVERDEFGKRLEYLALDESSEHYKSTRQIVGIEYWDMGNLPRISISGPAATALWPVTATLRPGPGTALGENDRFEDVLANCVNPTDSSTL